MSWPRNVKDKVLINCGRHCCICHKFCGPKIELHHIKLKSEGGGETEENCIPLCFDCHADQGSYDHKHPKGTKYSEAELVGHREKWYKLAGNNLGTGTSEHLNQDKETFANIIALLPIDPVINYLRNHDFGEKRIEVDHIVPVEDFITKMNNEPWFEFFDSDLQSLLQSLIAEMEFFDTLIYNFTFPTKGRSGGIQVPREWRIDDQAKYNMAVKDLNKSTKQIANHYGELYRLSRKKLGVSYL